MAPEVPTDKMIEALKSTNGLVSLAAKRLECNPQTIYNRAKRVEAVRQVIAECRSELADLAELSLRKAILDGQPWAVALALKTLRKEIYTERVEVGGPDGGPIEVKGYVSISPDDWDKNQSDSAI